MSVVLPSRSMNGLEHSTEALERFKQGYLTTPSSPGPSWADCDDTYSISVTS